MPINYDVEYPKLQKQVADLARELENNLGLMDEAMKTLVNQRAWVKRHHKAMARLNARHHRLRLHYLGDHVLCPECHYTFVAERPDYHEVSQVDFKL